MTARPQGAPRAKTVHIGALDRVGDAVFRGLARLGIGPAWSLTTRGRRTGRLRTVPVVPLDSGGQRWLVSPYGSVGWVLNARAAGQVQLSRGRTRRVYRVREASPEEAGPVLQEYVRIASATRRYFTAGVGAPVAAFVAEAGRHPVFALTPLQQPVAGGGAQPTGLR